jgi:ribonuclease BN (tRNA processing enzyme)
MSSDSVIPPRGRTSRFTIRPPGSVVKPDSPRPEPVEATLPEPVEGPLRLAVLGSSGSYGGPGNACSGYLVTSGGYRVWIDCGPGTLAAVQQHADLTAIDALVISHSHPDHWVELPVLRNALRYVLFHDGLEVYTTAEVQEFFRTIASDPDDPTFAFRTISDESTFEVGDMSFACSETDHPVETMAIRVEAGGRSLAYSADTGPQWSFKRFDQPIDMALCEGTLLAHHEGQGVPHLSSREAGDRAAEVGADRLVVTHLLPGADPIAHRREAEHAFGGPVDIARPGDWFTA